MSGIRALDMRSWTHFQTTNFRVFQIERVCRRQFQSWWKWQKVFQMDRKHWGKKKLLVTSNFSFSHCVFKRLVLQTCKNQGLFGKGLTQWLIICLLTELCGFTVLINNLVPVLKCFVCALYSLTVVTMQSLSFMSYRCNVIGLNEILAYFVSGHQ